MKILDSAHRPPAFVMSPHASSWTVEGDCAPSYLEVWLDPLGAYRLLGLPVNELSGQLTDLADVLGAAARRLAGQLRETPGWRQRFALMDQFLLRRMACGPRPSPQVGWAWRRLVTTGGTVPIGQVADEVGWSHKHLIVQFRRQAGLRPKTAARLIRFDRVWRHVDQRRPLDLRDRDLGELTCVRIPGDRGAGALASALTRQLARSVDELPAPEAARLGTAVVDVLAVALAGRLDRTSAVPEARERTLLHRIYAFVEQQLADPELSPRGIATAHHISLRYLYKLFEAEPVTVGGWIRRRRLERCRQDLRDPEQRYRPVAAIGAHWGFSSAAHFSRAFRDEYGIPPAEFRARSAMLARDET